MKRTLLNVCLTILAAFAAASIFAGCASAPAPAENFPTQAALPEATAAPEPAAVQEDVPGTSAARNAALLAMEKARDAKADVAVKADFDAAFTLFSQGEQENDTASYEAAEKGFIAATEKALHLLELAQERLNRARTEIKNAESDAAKFDAAVQAL
jgi:hypothetical protein